MHYESFTKLLDEWLTELGFERKRRAYWYRKDRKALIVVNLQKSAMGPGVYVNYGLCFSRKRNPKDFECEVFGRNPALSPEEFTSIQSELHNVSGICKSESIQGRVKRVIEKQIACLSEWQDLEKLRKRIHSKRVLEMIVDRPALGI